MDWPYNVDIVDNGALLDETGFPTDEEDELLPRGGGFYGVTLNGRKRDCPHMRCTIDGHSRKKCLVPTIVMPYKRRCRGFASLAVEAFTATQSTTTSTIC